MDNDAEALHLCRCRSYRASWFGFSLYGVYLVLTVVFALATDFSMFVGGRRNIGGMLGFDSFERHFDTFRTWARLLACFGLAAAWPDDMGWRRRAVLLLGLAVGDAILWTALGAVPLGLATEPTRHAFLFENMRMALGWSRYLLLASLAVDLCVSAGAVRAKELGRAARSTAVAGAAIWFVFFLLSVDWDRPWPLAPRRRLNIEALQLLMAYTLLNLVCLVQATLLTLMAARCAARMLGEATREAMAHDPWADVPASIGSK